MSKREQVQRVRQLIAPYKGQEVVVEGETELGPYQTRTCRCAGVGPFEGIKGQPHMLHLRHTDGGHEWLYLQWVKAVKPTTSG